MTKLTYEQMLELNPGDKVIKISRDRHEMLVCVGKHPRDIGMVFYRDGAWDQCLLIDKTTLRRPHEKFFTGDFDSFIVGNEITEYLKALINEIDEIYFEKL